MVLAFATAVLIGTALLALPWATETRAGAPPVVSLAICLTVIVGGIGFPVLRELRHELGSPRTWTLHTRLTVWTTLALLVAGTGLVTAFEWTNDATLGRFSIPGKLLAGFFGSVSLR